MDCGIGALSLGYLLYYIVFNDNVYATLLRAVIG